MLSAASLPSRHYTQHTQPENFLLTDKTEAAEVKATDFGLSVFFKDGQEFSDIVGSAYYVAPEVRTWACLLFCIGCVGGRVARVVFALIALLFQT